MKHFSQRRRNLLMPIVALAGAATALLVGVALARTFTLQVARNAKVTSAAGKSSTENIVVNSRGRAVYDLTGDNKTHPECTKANSCFTFWQPVTVSSAKKPTKASGINGKLGTWRRNGLVQVTLGGHPLYTFVGDQAKHVATGEGIKSFGGTWHVLTPSGKAAPAHTTTSTATTTTTSCGLYCY